MSDPAGELGPLPYPVELTPDLVDILGLLTGDVFAIAHTLRERGCAGVPLAPRETTAWVKHWLIGLYLQHGGAWRAVARQRLGCSYLDRARGARRRRP